MTDTQKHEMNVAIHEALGWKWHGDPSWHRSHPYWGKDGKSYCSLTDYCNSLDAMAVAEGTLEFTPKTFSEQERYARELYNVTNGGLYTKEFKLATATALQRATAFCRVKKIGPFK